MRNRYIAGDWNAACDVCGFKFKASELQRTWKNTMVCAKDFENRHPADFLRVQPETITTPWSRPEPEDQFVTVPYITPPA
jgi:hypothetical protein